MEKYPLYDFPKKFNLAEYCLDRIVNEGKGGNVALFFREKKYTYNDIQQAANKLAFSFLKLGIAREDRIAVFMNDSPEYIIAHFAAWKIGACLVNLFSGLPEHMVEYMLDSSNCKCLIVNISSAEQSIQILKRRQSQLGASDCKLIIVGGKKLDEHVEVYSFNSLALPEKDEKIKNICVATDRDSVAYWLWTSGSTGIPKAVVHLHHDSAYASCSINRMFLTESGDVMLTTSKLAFSIQHSCMINVFSHGATLALVEESVLDITPKILFDYIAMYKPTFFLAFPAYFYELIKYLETNATEEILSNLSRIRSFHCGGEAFSSLWLTRWMEITGKPILERLGSTEAFAYTSNFIDDYKIGSVGKILPGIQSRVLDANGNEVAAGEVGTLWIRTDALTPYYWNNNDATQKLIKGNDWHLTGNLVKIDSDGFVWFMGRELGDFKCAGEFVSPLQLAQAIEENSADIIDSCCVVLVPVDLVDKPFAFVVLKGGVSKDETTKKLLNDRVSSVSWWNCKIQPYDIIFLDSIPRTSNKKIDMVYLKENYSRREKKELMH